MADLFPTNSPDLFGGLTTQTTAPDIRNPESAGREAQLAALVNNPTNSLRDLQALSKSYQSSISQSGDESVRLEAATKQQTAELESLARLSQDAPKFDPTGEIVQGAQLAAMESLSRDVEQRKSYALEQESIKRIQDLAASGDYTQAKLLMNNLEQDGPVGVMEEMNAKRMIIQREIEKASVAKHDQGWFFDMTDAVVSMVQGPFNSTSKSGLVDIDKSIKNWYDGLFAGERQRNEAAGLWNMETGEFAKYVKDDLIPRLKEKSTMLGYHNNSEELDLLTALGAQTPSATETNVSGLVDNIGLLPLGKAAKIAEIPELFIKMGARKEAQQILAHTATEMLTKGAAESIPEKEVIKGLSAKAVAIDGTHSAVGTAVETGEQFGRAQDILKQLTGDLVPLSRLQPDEIERAMAGFEKQLNAEFSRPVKDVNWSTKTLADGSTTRSIEFLLGKAQKGGFADARQAQKYANSLGYGSSAQIINKGSGTKTLYRVEGVGGEVPEWIKDSLKGSDQEKATGRWFMDNDPKQMAWYKKDAGKYQVKTVKVPEADVEKYRVVNISETSDGLNPKAYSRDPEKEFFVPPEVAKGAQVVRDESGQYFVKLTRDMPEYGFFTNVLNVKASNHLSRRILNARAVGDEWLANLSQASGNKRAKLLRSMKDQFEEPFRNLRAGQRLELSQVLAQGENLGKWFTDDELQILYKRGFGRDATQADIKAYRTAQDINDVEFLLRNDETYKQKLVKGFQTVSLEAQGVPIAAENAFVDTSLGKFRGTRVFNVVDGTHILEDGLTQSMVERLEAQGVKAITLEVPKTLPDGTTVKTFFARGNQLSIDVLKRDQLNYRAGGHRMYKGKYFVKQTAMGVQPDTGKTFLANPNTYVVAETPAEAGFWADRMERARLAYLEGKGPADIDEIFDGHAGFPSGEKFLADMEQGLYDKNHPFEVKYDRELPEVYSNNGFVENLADGSEDGYDGWLRTTGKMYYSRKGEALKDFQGSLAPTLDPFKVIDKSLMNIANITSFSDYKTSAVERWLSTFGKRTNLREIDPSSMTQFAQAQFAKDVPQSIVQGGEAQRDIIKRNLGWKTDFDFQAEQYQRGVASWISGDDPEGLGNKAVKVVQDWWNDSNPLNAARSLAFDSKMGLFNVAQYPLQIGTAAAATMLDPVNGMKGWGLYPWMRLYLRKAASEADLDFMVKRGVHGDQPVAEFKEMMRSAKNSGFFEVSGLHQLISQHGPSSVAGATFMKSDGAIRTAGRFFFNEGEITNRSVAWKIAWEETKKALPGVSFKSPEFQQRLAGRAEQYAFNMSEQSAAWWQKGVLSIPTQFWAYNVRMMEAMLGNEFTRAQRSRLIIGQSLLFGTAGAGAALPVLPVIADKLKEHNAPNMNGTSPLETFYGSIDRGLLDTAIYHTTGLDIQASARYGTGNWLSDTVKDLLGYSSYGEKSFTDVATGATFGILGQYGKGLYDVTKYSLAESGGDGPELNRDAVLKLASNISTFSNAYKAYMVFNYGTLLSNKGTTLVSDLPKAQAFATALSFQPGELDEISSIMGYKKNRTKAVTEASKMITNYRTRMLNEPDNREEIMSQINLAVKLLPPDIRKDALRKAHRDTAPSFYEGLVNQIQKEKVKDGVSDGSTADQ